MPTARVGSLDIAYDDSILEPRPWTARQSEWAAELLATAPPGPVLELCSGAGHIGLLAVFDAPDRRLVSVDASPSACAFARQNAQAAGLAERVDVREGYMDAPDVLGPDERFACVIADPPWVPHADTGRFPADPLLAIDGGETGMDVAWLCLRAIDAHLLDGGFAILQLGVSQQADYMRSRLDDPAERYGLRVVEQREYRGRSGGVLVLLRGRRSPGASSPQPLVSTC